MPTTPTTVSTCISVTEEGTHRFEIYGYSEHRGMGSQEFIRSGTFSVGGYDWAIFFYPDDLGYLREEIISVRLELLSEDTKVRVSSDLRLLSQATGLPFSIKKTGLNMLESGSNQKRFSPHEGRMLRSEFEASEYLQDDHLTIECVVTVKRPVVSATEFLYGIEVPPPPPSNIREQLGGDQSVLFDLDADNDVTFSVGGETFTARRKVLALRSPVFKAELYGPMSEARAQTVTIDDMEPAVFRALLHFINTDSLPDDVDHQQQQGGDTDNDDCEMIWHLLEAADRYGVDRLKVICESILVKNLDAETVSTTLALASQHSCDRLRDICLQYVSSRRMMDAVVATQGYKNLKMTCPSAVIEMFEKTMRLQNIK